MEVLVPGCLGALTCACLALALPGPRAEAGRREGRVYAVDAWARSFHRVGELLEASPLVASVPLRRAADELCEVRVRGAALGDRLGSPGARIAALGAAVLAGALAGGVASFSALGALVGAMAPVAALLVLAGARGRARERELEGAMPEAFGALAIALGSGHSLSQAMRYVGGHAAEPIRTEFMRVSFSLDCGVPAAEALDVLLERLPAPGLDLVALALKVSQRTGAPLKDLLAAAAGLVGTRIELKRRLDVKTSQARMSARMVAAMPVAMVCGLSLISADFRRGVATPMGAMSVALALAMNAAAWLIIRKIMRVRL